MKISLDLLPQDKKNQIRRNKIFGRIIREEILFIVPIIVFVLILLNVYYILNYQFGSLSAAGIAGRGQDKYQELNKYEERFKQVNERVDLLSKIQNGHFHWLNVLERLAEITPDGVYLNSISSKNYQVFLLGKAKTREDLLKFKDNLEGADCFQNINVPLSNLVVKEDIDFQMDLQVNKECLRKQ